MSKDKQDKQEEMVVCPVGRFFMDLEKVAGTKTRFFEHLTKSRIEILKAVRSLVDERIETLEGKGGKEKRKKMGLKKKLTGLIKTLLSSMMGFRLRYGFRQSGWRLFRK